MSCAHCADTGSLSKSMDGYLNCGFCEVANERAKLDIWLRDRRRAGELLDHIASSDAWLIYQHGAAAMAVATN